MKHINEWNLFKKKNTKNYYLITYRVANFRVTIQDGIEKRLSEPNPNLPEYGGKLSQNYEYLIDAENEAEAEEKFTSLWNQEVYGFHPSPELDIISVENAIKHYSNTYRTINKNIPELINSVDKKIHTF